MSNLFTVGWYLTMITVGFLGFGEVAAVFSAGLRQRGVTVAAYDIVLDARPGGLQSLQQRTRVDGIAFCTLPDLLRRVDYVLSTVTSDVALLAAQSCVPHLQPDQVYVDLNATAPRVKRAIAQLLSPTGARFVEGAILGAVGVSGAQTRVLLGGPHGRQTASDLTGLGLNTVFYHPEIGRASTFKLLRSVFSKGLEALLLEFLLAGHRADIQDDLWGEVRELFTSHSFDQVASNWIRSHTVAYERRQHEMLQVLELLHELDVEPVMSAATNAFFERSKALRLKEGFTDKPDRIDDVIAALDARLARTSHQGDGPSD